MKIFLIMLCLIFLTLPVFAEYKPIPPERSAEYKAEIQNIIDTNYTSTKNQIYEISIEAKNLYNHFCCYPIDKNFTKHTLARLEQLEYSIDIPIFDIFVKIINITNKYVDISNDIPQTGYYGELWKFMQPYFDNYNINTKNLNMLSEYAVLQGYIIENYLNNLSKYNH